MARFLKPPVPVEFAAGEFSVFLAGSIEMGRADGWQTRVETALADLPIAVLNPRREAWNDSWEQSIANPMFRTQVEWELDGIERAALVAMYFAPETKSPITLLELGLAARSGKLVVCCPPGYWRRGNVEVVCARYGATMVEDLGALIAEIRRRAGGAM
jgi:hypothetical protein